MKDQSFNRYIKHSLHNSPSKTAYSFSKVPRFQQRQHQISNIHTQSLHQYHKSNNLSPNKLEAREAGNKKKEKDDFQLFAVRKQLARILKQMEKDRLLPKQEVPGFTYTYMSKHRAQREEEEAKRNEKTKYSPQKRYESPRSRINTINNPIHSKSSAKIINRNHTETANKDQDPYGRVTCSGYYPTGLETKASGKYFCSKIKSVAGYSFGQPSARPQQVLARQRQNNTNPTYYNKFSQFGYSRY